MQTPHHRRYLELAPFTLSDRQLTGDLAVKIAAPLAGAERIPSRAVLARSA
jgi:hypothetical protein